MRFVLLMPFGRTGSNLLVGILVQSPEIARIVNEKTTGIQTRARKEAWSHPRWRDEERRWVDNFLEDRDQRAGGEGWVGAKLSVSSFADPAGVARACEGSDVKTIHLDRRNTLRTAVSVIAAEAYAEYHHERYGKRSYGVKPGREAAELEFDVPPKRLYELMQHLRQQQECLREHFGGTIDLRIYYEDLLMDLEGVVVRIADLLDIGTFEFEIPYVKNLKGDWQERVTNLAELRASLEGTPYQKMLDMP